jgi:hypothetical protein
VRLLDSQKFWFSDITSHIGYHLKGFLNHHAEDLKALDSEIQTLEGSTQNISYQ